MMITTIIKESREMVMANSLEELTASIQELTSDGREITCIGAIVFLHKVEKETTSEIL